MNKAKNSPKRKVSKKIRLIIEWDKKATQAAFNMFDTYIGSEKYQSQMKCIENSCHGISWIVIILAMIYFGAWPGGYEMWINLLVYMTIDIIFVGMIKSFSRRRRPNYWFCQKTSYWLIQVDTSGIDKFSFPSGHASRSLGVALFFWSLYPTPWVLSNMIFAWSMAVSASKVFLGRHYILDVVAGMALSIAEFYVMQIMWIDETKAKSLWSYLGGQEQWSSSE